MRGTPRNNKSTRPAASCFHPFFGRFGTPDETLALVFIYFFKRMAQRTFSFPALCFASDDPRTSCLFTNTAHVIRYVLTCQHTLLYKDLFSLITHLKPVGGGGWGVFLGICGGTVPHGCPNPDPISSDQKKSFSTPVVSKYIGVPLGREIYFYSC